MGQNSYEDDSECHTFEETPMCKKPPLDTAGWRRSTLQTVLQVQSKMKTGHTHK